VATRRLMNSRPVDEGNALAPMRARQDASTL